MASSPLVCGNHPHAKAGSRADSWYFSNRSSSARPAVGGKSRRVVSSGASGRYDDARGFKRASSSKNTELPRVKLPSCSRGNNETRILCLARSARSRPPGGGMGRPAHMAHPLRTARSNSASVRIQKWPQRVTPGPKSPARPGSVPLVGRANADRILPIPTVAKRLCFRAAARAGWFLSRAVGAVLRAVAWPWGGPLFRKSMRGSTRRRRGWRVWSQ
jgi:hypothetical protein